jgi:hypothetical protein
LRISAHLQDFKQDLSGMFSGPSVFEAATGILKATGMAETVGLGLGSGFRPESPGARCRNAQQRNAQLAVEQTSTGWLKIWQPENGVNNPKPMIGALMQEWHGWVLHPADKTEVCDVQFVASLNSKVRDFIRTFAGTGGISIMAAEEMSNVCECLQRFLTYAPGEVLLMQADCPKSQDQVTRRQSIIYDIRLVDLLFSICCDLEQFNPTLGASEAMPGAESAAGTSLSQVTESAAVKSLLSHAHICKDPEESHVRRLCANCFETLTLLVRKNHIVGMHLSDKINSLVEPLDHLAKALSKGEDMAYSPAAYLQKLFFLVQEIYHDSPAALANMQVSHLRKLLELFDKPDARGPLWHAALLRILGTLCIYRARDASAQMSSDDASVARASLLLQSAKMGGTYNSRRSGDYMGIPNNQKHIMELMAVPRNRQFGQPEESIFAFFPRSCISAQDRDVMLMAFFREGSDIPDWQPAEEVLQVVERVQLFNSLLIFLKNTALGRGPIIDQMIRKITRPDESDLFNYERAVHILLCERCPSRTRAIVAAFVINVFIDNAPQEDCTAVLRFQDWSQLESSLATSSDRSPENTQRFAVLQAFLLMHLEGNDVQGQDFDNDSLLEECLKMLFFLVRFGFYSHTIKAAWDQAQAALIDPTTSRASKRCFAYTQQRIAAMWAASGSFSDLETWAEESLLVALLIQPLWLLLDISSDLDVTSPEAAARLKVRFSVDKLLSVADQSETEHKHVVLGCKKWACRILDLVANVRLNKRIRIGLQVFEADFSNGKQLGVMVIQPTGLGAPAAHKVKRAEFEQIFQVLDMNVEKAAPMCLQLLVDPAMQLDVDSSYAVLRLLLRLFGERQELMRTLADIQLVVDPQVMYVYRETSELSQHMSTLNVRLAACEHKLLEAIQLHENMAREEEVKVLVLGLDGKEYDHPSASQSNATAPEASGGSALDLMGNFGSSIARAGTALEQMRPKAVNFRWSSGELEPPVEVKLGTLMDGKGGVFDNLLGAPSHLFDKLNEFKNSKTFKTPLGTTSSLSMRPSSMQEHRQVIQMRRIHAAAKTADTASAADSGRFGTPKSTGPRGVLKGGRTNLMRDVEAEAETRLCNESCTNETLAFDASLVSELKNVVGELEQHLRRFLVIGSSSQKADTLQHMFRTLGVHSIVLDSLTALLSNGSPRMPQDDTLNQLLYQSFAFLAMFASRQPANQEIIYGHLHTMIVPQLMNPRQVYWAASEALMAVFQDNRVLSTRLDESSCSAIFFCLTSCARQREWRCIYLRCLTVMLAPRGIPIKRNQTRVIRHLEQHLENRLSGLGDSEEEVLPLYLRSRGLAVLRCLMDDKQRLLQTHLESLSLSEKKAALAATAQKLRQEQGGTQPFTAFDDFSPEEAVCRVNFYQETLNLLAECAVGAVFEVEQACQRFVPLDHLAELIQAEWCTPKVKSAALRLAREAFYDVADAKARKRAWLDRNSWKVVEYLETTLRQVLDRSNAFYRRPLTEKEERNLNTDTPPEMESLPVPLEQALVIESLKLLAVFIGKCFLPKSLTARNEEHLLKMLWVLTRMVDDGGLTSEVKSAVMAVIAEFKRWNIGMQVPQASGSVVLKKTSEGAARQRQVRVLKSTLQRSRRYSPK